MIDFEQDVEDQVVRATDEQLSRVSALARELKDLEGQIEDLEASLKTAKSRHNRISSVDLPQAMAAVGQSKFTLTDGTEVHVRSIYRAKIPDDRASAAFAWLRDQGHGDLIKQEVSYTFGRGEDNRAKNLVALSQDQGYDPDVTEGIHWQTLSAFVKEQFQAGKGAEIPVDLLGVVVLQQTKIITPKKKG